VNALALTTEEGRERLR